MWDFLKRLDHFQLLGRKWLGVRLQLNLQFEYADLAGYKSLRFNKVTLPTTSKNVT